MRRLKLLLALLLLIAPSAARAQPITVFATASLTDVMKDISAAWVRQGHPAPRLSFASSSTLARQIEQGAPAHIFASADTLWMDHVEKAGLIVPESRLNLLSNRLVLVAPKASATPVAIGPGLDLLALLGPGGRLATGNPNHVPVGIYARQALTKLGVWKTIEPRIASTEDVRAALLLVQRGEAPLGIVYATDALASAGVTVSGVFPEDLHERIVYPFAILRTGRNPEALALMEYLDGPEARAIFVARGFIVN